MSTVAQSDLNRQFMDQLPVVQNIIARHCWGAERRQNALCWAWELFGKYLPAAESPYVAAVAAARIGAKRRRTYGRPPRAGYVDAADRADSLATEPAQAAAESLSWSIDEMPARLQLVALPLAHGLTRAEAADMLGISTRTVDRRCQEIADWIGAR